MWILALAVAALAILLNRSLSERVDHLEKYISELEKRGVPTAPPVTAATPSAHVMAHVQTSPSMAAIAPSHAVVTAPVTPVLAPTPVRQAVPPQEDPILAWLQDNWLLKLGALLLLIGFGWLVSYAFLHNWIGPMGRILCGLGTGVAILGLGSWRIRGQASQGAIFLALGAAVVLLSMYAGRSIYDFFTPSLALTIMFATSAYVAFMSGLHNQRQLAILSVVLAGVAPMLTHNPSTELVGLFTYLTVVIFGAVWIAWWKDYREVVLTALIVVEYYSAPVLMHVSQVDISTLLLFGYAFAFIFYVVHTVALRRDKAESAHFDVITALGNAGLLAAWILWAAPESMGVMLFLGWAALFFVGAYIVFVATAARLPLALYAGIAVAYVAAATALQFDGSALTLAYIAEATVFSIGLFVVTRDVVIAQRGALTLIGPVLLSIASITSTAWRAHVLNEHFFVLVSISAAFFLLGVLYWSPSRKSTKESKDAEWAILGMGLFYLYILLWRAFPSPEYIIAFTVLGVIVSLTLRVVTGEVSAAQKGAFLLWLPTLLALPSIIAPEWKTAVLNEHFFVLAALAASFCALGGLYMGEAQQKGDKEQIQLAGGNIVVGSVIVYMLLWLALHAALPNNADLAVMIVLFVCTVVGIATYIIGNAQDIKGLRLYGGTLLAFVVGRLLIVDVWQMALTGRIITFIGIGVLLMSTAFLGQRKAAPSDTPNT